MLRMLSVLAILLVFEDAIASFGDNSPFYVDCEEKCLTVNCTKDGLGFKHQSRELPLILRITQWSCSDECQYDCTWKTVELFKSRNLAIPQFYGKWPFIRILGMQEPASVIFSLLNFFVHYTMLKKLRNEVRADSPFYWLWHLYALVCMNAWVWSALFHTRDFPFTELMDYSCAFSIILINCYCMVIRLLRNLPRFAQGILMTFFILFYYSHISYLGKGRFDYTYNMQINLMVGTFTAICWFGWCTWNRIRQPYVWKCAVYVSLMGLALLLEIVDVPPIFWVFDFHSLWHLSTAPLTYLFYGFIIDDCKYLRKESFEADQTKGN